MTSMDGSAFPAAWPDRIRALARGELAVVTPRAAATVLLLRDGPGGEPLVHMLRRRTSMAFAGGAYAYPGGTLQSASIGELDVGGLSQHVRELLNATRVAERG